jgi:hypothetical protein
MLTLTDEQKIEILDMIHSGFATKKRLKETYNVPMSVINDIYNESVYRPETFNYINDDIKELKQKLTKRKLEVCSTFDNIEVGDLVSLNNTSYYKVLGVYKYNFVLLSCDNKRETVSFADLYTGEIQIEKLGGK